MYKNVPKLIDILEKIKLENKSIEDDLLKVYEKLYENNIVEDYEITNLNNWIYDIKKLLNNDTI